MEYYDWTNCPKVIKAEVNTLLAEFSHLPDLHFSGMYLHGSLALGGFQPARSDIDIIVTTSERISVQAEKAAVELLLRVSKFPAPIDIWFLAEGDLALFQQPLPFTLHYNEQLRESFQQDLRSDAWQHWNDQTRSDLHLAIYLTVLQRKGICLAGKAIDEEFPLVPEQMFLDALVASFQEAHAHYLRDLVAFVLDSCRVYAYLRDGQLLSKNEGGAWGLAHLPELYHPLIQQSLALYRSERLGRPISRAVLNEFAAYMEQAILRQRTSAEKVGWRDTV
jgi:aminoglycoside adenylyltransferase-like protein/nucleotidyltransferase-like protein